MLSLTQVSIPIPNIPSTAIIWDLWSLGCLFKSFQTNSVKSKCVADLIRSVPSSISSFDFWHLAPTLKLWIFSHFLFLMFSSQFHHLQHQISPLLLHFFFTAQGFQLLLMKTETTPSVGEAWIPFVRKSLQRREKTSFKCLDKSQK